VSRLSSFSLPLSDAEYESAEKRFFEILDSDTLCLNDSATIEEANILFRKMLYTIQFAKGFGRN